MGVPTINVFAPHELCGIGGRSPGPIYKVFYAITDRTNAFARLGFYRELALLSSSHCIDPASRTHRVACD